MVSNTDISIPSLFAKFILNTNNKTNEAIFCQNDFVFFFHCKSFFSMFRCLYTCTVLSLLSAQGIYVSHIRWALIEMLKNTVKSRNMCVWGSSFQWFMGIIGGSTRANRPNRRCRGGRLLGYGRLWGIIQYMY